MTVQSTPKIRLAKPPMVDHARGVPGASYLRGLPGGASSVMALPMPVLRDQKDDVRQAWGQAAARTIDAMHNNGWIAGATETMISLIIGEGLKANFSPDFSWAGWDRAQTREWAKRAQRMFEADAQNKYHVDAGGRYNFAQLQAAAMRQWMATGNIVAEFPFFRRPGSSTATKIRLLPSHWMSGKSLPHENLDHGVYVDAHAAPVGYLFEFRDAYGFMKEVRRPAYDGFGRPIVAHIFDGFPGQVRGISPWAPVLRVLRDYDQLSNATLTASMIHAIFAATIESDYPTSEVLDALGDDDLDGAESGDGFAAFMAQKVGWAKNVDIDLSRHGKIAQLMVGEKLKLHSSEHPNSTYEPFANMLLREAARCVGGLFEDVTGDYRQSTQASQKAAISKQWPLVMYRRANIAGPFCNAYADAWLEEKIDSGALAIPGGMRAFLENKALVCRREWRGPAKPVPDELKAAKTHREYREMGVITDRDIAGDLGFDVDDVYEGRANEKADRDDLDIHGGVTNGGTNIDEMDLLNEPEERPSAE